MERISRIKGFLLAALGSIGWGISGVCSQYLFTRYNISANWLTSIRMLISGGILLLLALPKAKKQTFLIWKNHKDVLQLLSFALLGLLMCQATFLGAIKYSNSATATVLQSLNVVMMGVLTSLRNRTKLRGSQCAAIMLALAGTYLLATNGDVTKMHLSAQGLALGLLSAIGVVTYTLLSRKIVVSWGNLVVTGWGMLIGGGVFFLATKAWIIPAGLDFTAWVLIAVIVLIGTVIGFSVFLEGVKYIGPVKATLIGCLEPASAAVLSALFLKVQFTYMELAGFCCILLTVFISVLAKEK